MFIALVIGFVGGVVFSAYKLGPQKAQPSATPPHDHAGDAHIDELKKIVEQDPNNVAVWIELGNHYFDGQNFDAAIDAYQSALKIAPDNANVWTDMGVMYRRKGDSQKALEAFGKAQEIDPNHEVSLFNTGVVLMHDLRKPEEARQIWEKLIQLNPEARTPSGQPIKEMLEKMK